MTIGCARPLSSLGIKPSTLLYSCTLLDAGTCQVSRYFLTIGGGLRVGLRESVVLLVEWSSSPWTGLTSVEGRPRRVVSTA